jgi:DNA (cytosine-5)-methyltransferase 1
MRLLDLFCGAGGAAMGYYQAGFTEIVGVDIVPQPNYPFRFVQADALTPPFRLEDFDLVHASPPCQAYSTLSVMPNARSYPELVEPVRNLLSDAGVSYVIENVAGSPLVNPLVLCGSQFGLVTSDGRGLRRHRLFEAPWLFTLVPPCIHPERTIGVYGGKARDIALEKRHYAQPKDTRGAPVGVVLDWKHAEEAMGIDWMTRAEMSEAIPPAYTKFIGEQVLVQALEVVDG